MIAHSSVENVKCIRFHHGMKVSQLGSGCSQGKTTEEIVNILAELKVVFWFARIARKHANSMFDCGVIVGIVGV